MEAAWFAGRGVLKVTVKKELPAGEHVDVSIAGARYFPRLITQTDWSSKELVDVSIAGLGPR